MRAERLDERTDAKVAIASTSVPAPVVIAETVAQSVASGSIIASLPGVSRSSASPNGVLRNAS